MDNLFDLLQSQLTGDIVDALGRQMGPQVSPQQTNNAINDSLAILMNALVKNTSNNDGATALGTALDRDHDGSIFDDLMSFVNGTSTINNSRAGNGTGILKHVLGDNLSGAIDALTKSSGLNMDQAGGLLVKLAPLLLGILGRQRRTGGLNNTDLSDILARALGTAKEKATPQNSEDFLSQIFDTVGGNTELGKGAAKFGINILKNIFKK